MEEGKLVDALALADRCLHDGAPDSLLQLLIERGEETGGSQSGGNQWQGRVGGHHLYSSNWQYCIRLRNKTLAATLALKYGMVFWVWNVLM
jgi:zinc finger FYVE domain-containing protein 26